VARLDRHSIGRIGTDFEKRQKVKILEYGKMVLIGLNFETKNGGF
jgi:hypothetical protein